MAAEPSAVGVVPVAQNGWVYDDSDTRCHDGGAPPLRDRLETVVGNLEGNVEEVVEVLHCVDDRDLRDLALREVLAQLLERGVGHHPLARRLLGVGQGRALPVVENMAQYARDSGRLDDSTIDALLADVRSAVDTGRYLLVLPQFLATATA